MTDKKIKTLQQSIIPQIYPNGPKVAAVKVQKLSKALADLGKVPTGRQIIEEAPDDVKIVFANCLAFGGYVFSQNVIFVRETFPNQYEQMITLAHELSHAIHYKDHQQQIKKYLKSTFRLFTEYYYDEIAANMVEFDLYQEMVQKNITMPVYYGMNPLKSGTFLTAVFRNMGREYRQSFFEKALLHSKTKTWDCDFLKKISDYYHQKYPVLSKHEKRITGYISKQFVDEIKNRVKSLYTKE